MQFDFSRIVALCVPTAHKDPGILLGRSYRAWYGALLAGVAVVVLGGIHAGYEFMHIEDREVVITDPVTTARYRDADIKAALSRYDALRAAYQKNTSAAPALAPVPPVAEESVPATPDGEVATSSPLKVE